MLAYAQGAQGSHEGKKRYERNDHPKTVIVQQMARPFPQRRVMGPVLVEPMLYVQVHSLSLHEVIYAWER